MIKEIKVINGKKDFNGLILKSIQAYKELNPFGIEYIKFYELRDYNGHTSHHFIKSLKNDNLNIENEINKIINEVGEWK